MKRFFLSRWAFIALISTCITACTMFSPRTATLSPIEKDCIGRWAFISPDSQSKTCIVYHFGADRHVLEEHYYLQSVWPTTPRIRMVGKWRVDPNQRLIVEHNDGVSYVRDSMSGWLGEYLDDGRHGWKRPILTRFYDIKSMTTAGIEVECNRSGSRERSRLMMVPYSDDPTAVPDLTNPNGSSPAP